MLVHILVFDTTPKRFKKTHSKKYNMDSTSIAQYIATLEKRNSELLNENSELKEDQKRITQLRTILGVDVGNSESRPVELSEEIETDELFDAYIRRNGPAADLSYDEKFNSYHISDMLYWLSERSKNTDQKKSELYDEAAGLIYNLNHEIFSGAEALELFNRSEILSTSGGFSESTAKKIDKYLKMPKTT